MKIIVLNQVEFSKEKRIREIEPVKPRDIEEGGDFLQRQSDLIDSLDETIHKSLGYWPLVDAGNIFLSGNLWGSKCLNTEIVTESGFRPEILELFRDFLSSNSPDYFISPGICFFPVDFNESLLGTTECLVPDALIELGEIKSVLDSLP